MSPSPKVQLPKVQSPKVQSLEVRSTENQNAASTTALPTAVTPSLASPVVQQVAYSDTFPNAPACACCGPAASSGCQDSSISPAFGYAEPIAQDRNAYGIDRNEFLCNGDDRPPTNIVRRNDSLAGLNPSDTVVHYTSQAGDIEMSASNPVCMYAPRFASVRKVTTAVAGERVIGLSSARHRTVASGVDLQEGGVAMTDTTELAHAEVTRRIDAMRERNRGVPVDAVQQVIEQVDILAVLAGIRLDQLNSIDQDQHSQLQRHATAAILWTIDESVEAAIGEQRTPEIKRNQAAEGFTVYDFPDAGRLEILKLADRFDAAPGDTISFAITVRNVGDSPVNEVVLTDNLTTRLEYIAQSQTCSGGADFGAEANDVGSDTLVWKLTSELKVGESVTIRFRCKVR
jgi:uncharacterized repeat protein (TIGR01451 family)